MLTWQHDPMGSAPPPDVLRAPAVSSGDLVSVVSPSAAPDEAHLQATVTELEGWGLRVDVGAHALARHGITAGTDVERLSDLNQAFGNPEVRAVFASRGGAGGYRIAHLVDFDAVRADPKPLVGFSDITNFHVELWANTGLATIHGCLGHNQVADDVRGLLMEGNSLQIAADQSLQSAAVSVAGTTTGRLVGGNLRELAGRVGNGLPKLDGTILFLEDLRHVGVGQIDRNLNQLIASGLLDGVGGIALGLFAGFEDYEDSGWTILDVFRERLLVLNVPILGGIKAGHGGADEQGRPDQRALVLGAEATLDTEAATLSMGRCVEVGR